MMKSLFHILHRGAKGIRHPATRMPATNATGAPRLRAVVVLAVLAACSSAEPPVLTVGSVSFTERELLGLTEDRRTVLGHLTGVGLALADSAGRELGSSWIAERLQDRRLEILGAELLLEDIGVGDDVLEARYLTDPAWELTVRHILFFSERWRAPDHRSEAEAKAGRAMESLRNGADFASTAAELSEEPGAEGRQGLLTPGREGSWVPEFWAAALALEPGEISPVTETEYGYHILRLEDRTIVPFEEGRSRVVRTVADQAGDPGATLAEWMTVASNDPAEARRLALAEAERRGIEAPAGERTEIEREWDDLMYRWGATLGFRYGMSAAQVKAAALAALSDPGQGVELTRREVSTHAEAIERLHPVDRPAGG